MKRMENNPSKVIAFGDLDALIQELESQFDDSVMLPQDVLGQTQGCTQTPKCTGSCPC
ncbi:hypothetical protein [Nonomuraea sp. PA05]|uniref:hypothetical protein n=1 Tax=Nonomuraea sp. PA05 TaxID=2604466 RepID=UPI00165223C9|nr:hypothetical protein [Nonomuraea sp. PA05]